MAGIRLRRIVVLAGVVVAELVAAFVLTVALSGPAPAQLFDDRFPFLGDPARRLRQWQNQRRDFFNPFGQPERPPAPPVDYSRAPPPKKQEGTPLTSVVVMGDAMADWLAYGLEIAASESPDIGIVRKHRTVSGLIRAEVKNDPRGDHPDWPHAARDILNQEKANYVVFMIGLNDRKPIREKPEKPPVRGTAQPGQQANQSGQPTRDLNDDAEQSPGGEPVPAIVGREPGPTGTRVHEFRSEKWVELYNKRLDETIAALKSKNVPVFWVGLPPIRGTRASSDAVFLNDLYRGRAEKAGIVYVDVWDGFVDESGRFVQLGPDFEGQTRRLRSSDGVYFTQAGARKLAHYVEREIQRAMVSHATPIALPAPDEPVQQAPAARPGAPVARPLAGPVMPLSESGDSTELAGGTNTQRTITDALANLVLMRGESVSVPAGRSDDFAWPPRGIAPMGSDPVVATTTLPMTPMQPEKPVAASAPSQGGEAAKPKPSRPRVAQQRRAAPPPPPQPAFFFPFFRRW